MTDGYPARHYSISLPADAEDKSLAALFHHVGNQLSREPIALEDIVAITFSNEVSLDGDHDPDFTIVWS
ncbi:hypothetical protein [Kribbella sp. DT2]|uniref:hypothetical protein n=1 Tax=Kribbella sp. DT2 TaxID=3393427 RepID=UPI003CF401DE